MIKHATKRYRPPPQFRYFPFSMLLFPPPQFYYSDRAERARVKAENALLPVYRKELRKVVLENLQWMRAMKKDPTFKKVMETQKELKDTEGFDWLESTELAIDKRKFLLNRLYEKQPIPQDED